MREFTLLSGLLTMAALMGWSVVSGHSDYDRRDCYYDRYNRYCDYYPPPSYHYHDHFYHKHPVASKPYSYSRTCRYLASHPHLLRRIRTMLSYYFTYCYDSHHDYSNFHY
ncbi:uncharacterized protein LOC122254147 [Penaeus japonicus]|uniref:uncharacterized protein LOC122254147 n=1 Tax=Penaeus japonicus TaxID=27405 RepID=UPI001C71098F|nr:uncharacterized protein LOC122254147 [Penaeus japonicus]